MSAKLPPINRPINGGGGGPSPICDNWARKREREKIGRPWKRVKVHFLQSCKSWIVWIIGESSFSFSMFLGKAEISFLLSNQANHTMIYPLVNIRMVISSSTTNVHHYRHITCGSHFFPRGTRSGRRSAKDDRQRRRPIIITTTTSVSKLEHSMCLCECVLSWSLFCSPLVSWLICQQWPLPKKKRERERESSHELINQSLVGQSLSVVVVEQRQWTTRRTRAKARTRAVRQTDSQCCSLTVT